MLSIHAVRGHPRLRAPGIVPCTTATVEAAISTILVVLESSGSIRTRPAALVAENIELVGELRVGGGERVGCGGRA